MAAENFDRALQLVLASEGGYVDDPRDPGGPTNRGVTQGVYDAWRRLKGLPPRGVRYAAPREISDIYRRQYWAAVRGDDLPAGVDYAVFDEAVNSGPVRAIRDLQAALGVTADGHLGIVTLGAATRAGAAAVVQRLCDRRLSLLRRLRGWSVFGRGWANRVADVRANALKLAAGARTGGPKPVA